MLVLVWPPQLGEQPYLGGMQASCLLFSLSLEDSLQAGAWQQPPSPASTQPAPPHPSPAGNFKSLRSGTRVMLAHHSQTLAARPACLLIPLAPLPTSFLFPLIWSSICLPVSCCTLPSSPSLRRGGT